MAVNLTDARAKSRQPSLGVLQTAWIEQTAAAVRNDLANLCDRSGVTVLIQTCTIAALQC